MNVMKRAWEIAKEGVKKFGGKVKEYFAQALVIAWKEVKNKVENFGFIEVQKKNGVLVFAVDNMEGMEVSFLTQEKNGYTGKMYTKRHPMNFKAVTHNETQKTMRLYSISLDNEAVEIKVGEKVATLKINRGNLAWV